jgi:cell cycle checkpoint protein
MQDEPPILTAVSSSARQLFTLLRCVAFANKAHVLLTEEGLRFSVDEASVMEGALPSACPINASTLTHA